MSLLLRGKKSPASQLTALVRSYGGTVYLAGVDNYQLANGTTPAVVDSVVGYLGDLAGSNDATQATTNAKPLLKQTNGKRNLLFDNSNDYLLTQINPTSSGYMCVAARQDEALGSANALIGAYKTSATTQAGQGLYISSGGLVAGTVVAADGSQTVGLATSSGIAIGVSFIAEMEFGIGGAKVRKNGANEGTSATYKDGANSGTVITIGGRNTGTSAAPSLTDFFGGAIFGVVHIPSVPSATDQANIRKLMAQIAGVPGVV